MKKRKQLLIALTALIILAAGVLILKGKENENAAQSEQSSSPQPRKSFTLTDVADDELASLSVENSFGSYTLISGISGDGGFFLENDDRALDPNAATALGYSMCTMKSSERLEESFDNPSDYGLDSPSATLTLNKRDGGIISLKLGNPTPSGSGFYCILDGDPALYILPAYLSRGLMAPMSVLLDRSLPEINLQELQRLTIKGERTIDIVPYFPHEALSSSLTALLMVKPYARPVAVNSQTYGESLELFAQNFQILDFAGDGADTGLENGDAAGGELYMQDKGGKELTLSFGKTTTDGSAIYCRISGRDEIVILPVGAASLMKLSPFDLSDRFVRLVGIEVVSAFSLTTSSESWEGTIHYLDEEKTEGEYSFQGRPIEEDPFKKLYQEILYLLFEGEVGKEYSPGGEPRLTLSYTGTDGRAQTSAGFYDYDMDYYAVSIDGFPPEFLIGKYQIEKLLTYLREFQG